MKKLFFLLINVFLFNTLSAQLEGVIVEPYYIADANDAMDTSGGILVEGIITYRIYIDMLPGSKLLKVYGDDNHPLTISSTTAFFNNTDREEIFGKDIRISWLEGGTVALDTWLTIGQASRNSTDSALIAVPKTQDFDGSIIGGPNHEDGLLTSSEVGIPLTESDGYVYSKDLPNFWSELITVAMDPDSTIFNSNTHTSFTFNSTAIENDGISGAIEADNQVLIAQLTTTGDLSFDINVVIQFEEGGVTKTVNYVATDSVLMNGEEFNPLLSYPWTCGCKDPDYLEASPNFACEDNSLCQTRIVYGCLDENACNYNESANYNIDALCCYVGYCNDLDISIVCPELPIRRLAQLEELTKIFPNPTQNFINVELNFEHDNEVPFSIFDALGRECTVGTWTDTNQKINVANLDQGLYYIRFLIDDDIVLTKSVSIF